MMKLQRLSGLAAGIALSAASAHSQTTVQIYGVMDAYVGQKQLASATGAKTTTVDSGGMSTSHWGIRGSEDLGSGLRALFDMSGFIRLGTGDTGRFAGDTMFSRGAQLGLQGGWGTLRAGRLSTPNFISTIRLNPFGDSATLSPMVLHTYIGGQPLSASIASGGPAGISDSAHNSAISYSSPTVNGVSGVIQYSPGDIAGSNANNRLGYSLTYGKGPVLLSFSGEQIDRPTLPPPPVVPASNQKQKQDTHQIGGSYDFATVKLFAQYSRTRTSLPGNTSRGFVTQQVGASAPVGAGHVLFSVATTRKAETALTDVKRTTWSLGYDHTMSKRTDAYAAVMRDKVTGLQSGTTFALGLRHRF